MHMDLCLMVAGQAGSHQWSAQLSCADTCRASSSCVLSTWMELVWAQVADSRKGGRGEGSQGESEEGGAGAQAEGGSGSQALPHRRPGAAGGAAGQGGC